MISYRQPNLFRLLNKVLNFKYKLSGLFSNKNISLKEKGKVLNDIVIGFLTSRGYTGPMPEIRIGENTFAVDSKNSSKLNERKENPNGPQEIIYISKNDLTSSEIMQILGHELRHLATYDKDQKTADNIESKIDKIETGKDGDYTEYLASLKDKYNNLPSLEESLQLEKQIPNEYKEELVISTSTALLMAGTTIIAIQLSDEEQRVLRTEQARKAFNEFKKDFEDTMEEVEIYAFFAGEYLKKYADDWNVGYNGALNKDNFLELPESLKDRSTIIHENLPPNTGNLDSLGGFDLLPEDDVNTKIPPTKTDEDKEFEGNIVDPLPEPIDKDSLTTADKNPPKVENNHILFITNDGTLEIKNTDIPKDYTLNEDGTITGPKGGEYKQIGYTKEGKIIFTNNKEFFLFENGEKKTVSSPKTGGVIYTGLTRPPLTKATKDKIAERYIDNGDGTFTHKLAGKKIIGPIDYGHIYSWENRRLIKAAESLGMDQKTFNQYVNSRDDIFQFENHYENISHKNEKSGNNLEYEIVNDMKKFLKELK